MRLDGRDHAGHEVVTAHVAPDFFQDAGSDGVSTPEVDFVGQQLRPLITPASPRLHLSSGFRMVLSG